jgi:hypothetical protein
MKSAEFKGSASDNAIESCVPIAIKGGPKALIMIKRAE